MQCSLRSSQPTGNILFFRKKQKLSYHLDPFLPSGLFQWSFETKTALVISTYYMWPTHLLDFLNFIIFGKQNRSEVPHYVIPFTTSFSFTNPSIHLYKCFTITYPHSCYCYGQNYNVKKIPTLHMCHRKCCRTACYLPCYPVNIQWTAWIGYWLFEYNPRKLKSCFIWWYVQCNCQYITNAEKAA